MLQCRGAAPAPSSSRRADESQRARVLAHVAVERVIAGVVVEVGLQRKGRGGRERARVALGSPYLAYVLCRQRWGPGPAA